jgi:ABC-type amino acid transport substrate-binding protein
VQGWLRLLVLGALLAVASPAQAEPGGGDLDAVRARGVLRHLGVRYASFVTGSGDGFDVDLMRRFAARIGVRYEFVETEWNRAFADLTGHAVGAAQPDPARAPAAPVRGDALAAGVTVLPWRERSVAFSAPVFPTQVWVVAPAGSAIQPVRPGGSVEADIAATRKLLAGRTVLGVPGTCLDPSLYELKTTRARLRLLEKARLDEVAPALIRGEGDLALLDVADAMLALQSWPGSIKVIGPVSPPQEMAVAFRRDAPRLREAFDAFLAEARRDGSYRRLVQAYFPGAISHFPAFFGEPR